MPPNGRAEKEREAAGEGEDHGPPTPGPTPPYLRLQPFMASVRELRTPHLWRDVIAEVVLTFLLLFFVMGMGFNFNTPEKPTTPLVLAGLGTGVYVFALIEGFGHINLACMNPAAVILFTLTGKLSVIKGFLLITAECLGSILGTSLVYTCAPASARANFRPLSLHPDLNVLQGVAMEVVVTASLVFIIAGALDDRNRKVYMPGLPVGLAVGAGILTAGNFTGGALNPMITLGPAVVTGIWTHQWVYWAGPIAGAFIGTLVYHVFTYDKGVFKKPEQESQEDQCNRRDYEPNQNNNQNGATTPLRRSSQSDGFDNSRC